MTIRIGLIGAGGIARPHVDGYNASPDAVITAVADVSEENAQARAEQAGGDVKIYADFNDLVTDDNVDAVDICLPHHLHAPAILAAAKAGKHIICEKPLCLSVSQADEIAAAVEGSGVTLDVRAQPAVLPGGGQGEGAHQLRLPSATCTRSAPPTASTTTSTRRTWAGAQTRRRSAAAS